MTSQCSQSARKVPSNSEATDHEFDQVGEYIQVAVSADSASSDLDDAIDSFGDGGGQIGFDKDEECRGSASSAGRRTRATRGCGFAGRRVIQARRNFSTVPLQARPRE